MNENTDKNQFKRLERLKRLLFFILFFLCACPHASRAADPKIMLPEVYTKNTDIAGWLVSEKLDGVRGYWDGRKLLSKHGITFHPPAAFLHNFPHFALEGEIWGGRGTFERTVAEVRRQQPDKGWLALKFAIFDVPKAAGPFVKRLQKAKHWFANHHSAYAFIIPQRPVQDKTDLAKELRRVEKLGGEGLIVRRPDALYQTGRSDHILKVKSHQDMEADVVARLPGTGKNKGKLGSLLVQLPNGTRFKIGTGLTDEQRKHPPPVGSTITFKYYGFYKSGIPKFPSFLRVRADKGL